MAKKKRADLLLYEQGGAESQDLAARLIMAGRVFILPPDSTEDDPGEPNKPGEPSELDKPDEPDAHGGPGGVQQKAEDGNRQGRFAPRSAKARQAGAAKSCVTAKTAALSETLRRVEKPGEMLPAESLLIFREKNPYVSRGAYKLLTALQHYSIDVTGLVALDAGASTGGFTDCLLQRGAARVYAVDVGFHQLHEKLRADSRVISMESTNLRLAGPDLLPEKVDLIVSDVSFISLKAILPPCMQFLKPGGQVVALIKPQFEVGSDKTVKGVVRDPELRKQAVDDVVDFADAELGLRLQGVIPAAIKGPKGNQEYLAWWKAGE